nr:MAG: Minor capsid protein [Bacteriophage sp.]
MADRIKQPKDKSIQSQKAQLSLIWDKTFGSRNTARFFNVQKYVDSECIRLMVPYTPMQNGILMKVAVLGTKIGSGRIYYNSPYARYQYYGKLMVSSVTGSAYAKSGESKVLTDKDLKYNTSRHPLAQRLWFEAMKSDKKEQILRGAAAVARRG